MFEEIKMKMIEEPEHIIHLLDFFGFENIRLRPGEIRCAFEHGTNPTAIVIRLKNNEALFVKDYERNCSLDIINYIIIEKNIEFKEVINAIKNELGIECVYGYKRHKGLFGGVFDGIKSSTHDEALTVYPEYILNEYGNIPNMRFFNDGISYATQKKFGIGFSVPDQRITIPIRAPSGELCGVKGRCNYTPDEFEPKYLYLTDSCQMSKTLYGYYENYNSLYHNDVWIFESEKSVMLCDTYGFDNAVALGSNSLSSCQAKLIMSLCPKCVTFLLDKDLPIENTFRNVEILKQYCFMQNTKIRFWNWSENITLDEKSSPADGGKDELIYILENETEVIEL